MELRCLMMEWLFDDGAWLFQVAECVGYVLPSHSEVLQGKVGAAVESKTYQGERIFLHM